MVSTLGEGYTGANSVMNDPGSAKDTKINKLKYKSFCLSTKRNYHKKLKLFVCWVILHAFCRLLIFFKIFFFFEKFNQE